MNRTIRVEHLGGPLAANDGGQSGRVKRRVEDGTRLAAISAVLFALVRILTNHSISFNNKLVVVAPEILLFFYQCNLLEADWRVPSKNADRLAAGKRRCDESP